MPQACKQGDVNTAGGMVTGQVATTVLINNLPAARIGSTLTSDTEPTSGGGDEYLHRNPTIIEGMSTVIVEGIPIAYVGAANDCSHTMVTGSLDVYVDNTSFGSAAIATSPPDIVLPEEYSLSSTTNVRREAGRYAPLDDPPTVILVPKTYPEDTMTVKTPVTAPASTVPVTTPAGGAATTTETPDYTMSVSTNYTLGDYSIKAFFPHQIKAQAGFKVSEIIDNIKELSIQSVEPLRTQYPGFRINSGFRTQTTAISQHEKGQAVDVQWPGVTPATCLTMAQWFVNNVIFDQFIFEHGNGIWFHISYNRRSVQQRKQILTMFRGVYSPGLTLYI